MAAGCIGITLTDQRGAKQHRNGIPEMGKETGYADQ